MAREQVAWRTARPLWAGALEDGNGFEEPAILRFAGDDFMDVLQTRLACEKAELASLVAGTETWQDPGAGLDTTHETPSPNSIKLYQPTHGRYYIATGSLVCAKYGLPDKRVAANEDEVVSFLLRRLAPTGAAPIDPSNADTFTEYGWKPIDGGGYWDPVTAGMADEDEQRLPLFPMPYGDTANPNRLLAGLIPVSARESFEKAPRLTTSDVSGSSDPLAGLIDTRLQELEPVVVALQGLIFDTSTERPDLDLMREALFFAMVDLADWLNEHLPGILDGSFAATNLASTLDNTFDVDEALSWRQGLQDAKDNEAEAVFAADNPAPQPVNGLDADEIIAAIGRLDITIGNLTSDPPDPLPATATGFFADAVVALPTQAIVVNTSGNGASATSVDPSDPRAVYVARFLYERPQCLPSERQKLSKPSRPFMLAPFHDPDAPARPVRIPMPIDTSPAGLRKFPKNVSMVLSAELRKQMQRVDSIKLSDIDDGNIPDGPSIDFGMICSLSIPIITIAALILLMIIVSLLNIVFFWLPLFKICLPVPKVE